MTQPLIGRRLLSALCIVCCYIHVVCCYCSKPEHIALADVHSEVMMIVSNSPSPINKQNHPPLILSTLLLSVESKNIEIYIYIYIYLLIMGPDIT